MLDKETRQDIKYLAMIKQKEQLEKEIKEFEDKEFKDKYGIEKSNISKISNYFKD